MIHRSQLYPVGTFVGSALLLSLGFPPFDFGPAVFVALVPLLLFLSKAGPKQSWKGGYLFGLVFSLGQLHWLDQLTVKWTGSMALGLVPWLLASFAMACYFGLACFLMQRCFARGWVWAIPLVWAGVEIFRTYIPVLAFPWGLLATPLWRFPLLIQPAHLGTLFLMSAWVVAVNLILTLALKNRGFERPALPLAVPVVLLTVLSIGAYEIPDRSPTARVTIGQPGIDMAFESPSRIDLEVPPLVRRFSELALEQKSRLLILPEGIAHASGAWRFFDFPLNPAMPILFGAQREGDSQAVYQSAIGFDGQWHAVDKTRLVIFGEFVPARNVLPFLNAFNLPGGDLSAGKTGVRSMDLGGLRVGPLLCFEGLFPDLSYRQALNRAQFIAIMSDDDWFMNSSAPQQLREASIWRAVETGLPVVRVGSLGYSLACNAKGVLIATVPLGRSEALTTAIPLARPNPWIILLPAFPVCCIVVTLVLIMPKKARDERRKNRFDR